MKSYEDFVKEAYTKTYGDIEEGWGAPARWAGRALRGVPGLGTAVGLGVAGYRLAHGDKTGAALAAGSAIPGPVGWGFLGADIAREVSQYQKSQKNQPKPKPSVATTTPAPAKPSSTPSKPATTPSATPSPAKPAATPAKPVLSKLGGVPGTGVGKDFVATKGGWSASEKERYEKYKSKA